MPAATTTDSAILASGFSVSFAFKQHDAALGLGLGLDYGFSRQLGLGVTLRFDQALVSQETRSLDALLRAEYRWGW